MADPNDPALIVDDDSSLTPEEIEAIGLGDLLDDDGNLVLADEATATEGEAANAADTSATGEDDEGTAADGGAPAPADMASAAPGEAAEEEEDVGAPPPAPPPDVSTERARIAAADAEKDALFDKYDAGNLTSEEYKRQTRAIDERVRADIATVGRADDVKAQITQSWNSEVARYFDRYPELTDDRHVSLFDNAVKLIGQRMNPDTTFRQVLIRAHALYESNARALGLEPVARSGPPIKPATTPAAKAEAEPAVKPQATPRKTAREVAPKTVRSIPAADNPAVVDGRYGQLEQLAQGDDPVAFEEALARLSPEEQEEFASLDLG